MAQMARFWWGKGSQNKIHWCTWDRMTDRKAYGGLGFRDLTSFNLALLAKQGWRIINQPSAILSKILKEKYFKDSSFMEATTSRRPSWGWRSLLQGRKILEQGVRWRVGTRQNIKIWDDPWIPKPSTYRTLSPRIQSFTYVHELLTVTKDWNLPLIRSIFKKDDQDVILGMPISKHRCEDKMIWHPSRQG